MAFLYIVFLNKFNVMVVTKIEIANLKPLHANNWTK
jgi:hypothetical protein